MFCTSWTYLVVIGLIPDELVAWNALLVTYHPNIFRVFAVRHTKTVGLTLSQALFSTSAVHVVEPDTA